MITDNDDDGYRDLHSLTSTNKTGGNDKDETWIESKIKRAKIADNYIFKFAKKLQFFFHCQRERERNVFGIKAESFLTLITSLHRLVQQFREDEVSSGPPRRR